MTEGTGPCCPVCGRRVTGISYSGVVSIDEAPALTELKRTGEVTYLPCLHRAPLPKEAE